jgi:TfoX/Sxy family transcriptional regulator of competence genes
MPYNEKLAARIRKTLIHLPDVEEKKMFKGLTFMVNGKMCVCVSGDELMCRFDPAMQDVAIKKKGFRIMIMKNKTLKGYGYINESGIDSKKDFDYWINLCLSFNEKLTSVS